MWSQQKSQSCVELAVRGPRLAYSQLLDESHPLGKRCNLGKVASSPLD